MNILDPIEHHATPLLDARLTAHRLGVEWELLDSLCVKIWGSSVESLTHYDLLAIWQQANYEDICLPEMCNIFDESWHFLSPQERKTLSRLQMCIVSEMATIIKAQSSEMGRVCSWFKKHFTLFIPGGELVKVESIQGKRPDFLVKEDDVIYPVECKLCFNKNAVKQLQGYMKLWEVDRGYAVASKTVCDIPESVIFIQCP